MRIKNMNVQKSFILSSKDVKKGGRKWEDGDKVSFEPKTIITVDDKLAVKLSKEYPEDIELLDEVVEKKEKK